MLRVAMYCLSLLGGFSRASFAIVGITRKILFMNFSSEMNSKALALYEEAIYALNGLQSNAKTLQRSRAERGSNPFHHLICTEKHLNALGIQLSDLDSLNIIHVAGTKGKGSTCAFIESILRKHGFKTGFYSSPHLVSVNERIRINGSPLDKNLFTRYFWEVYKSIQQNLESGESMPHYSMFLTVMAFYVFLKEKIEAAVIEVGIGGLYDCTNVIKKPVVVAVTSLGIDHVLILGRTLPEIAAQKAGIFKPGVPAFTVPQHESAMKVLYEKAKEVNCPLRLAPSLQVYDQDVNLGIPGIIQRTNASLALQTVTTWMKRHSNRGLFEMNNFINEDQNDENLFFVPMAPPFFIESKFREGLESCEWPGRFQTIKKNNVTIYLDGAHTQESMKYCVKWFQEAADGQKTKLQSTVLRVLLFNCTGERKAECLLDPLADVNFDLAVFSPNRRSVMKDSSSDQSNFMVDPETEIQQCITNKEIWCHLMRSLGENELSRATQTNSSVLQNEVNSVMLKEDNTVLFCCLGNAMDWLLHNKNIKHCTSCDKSNDFNQLLQSVDHIQILVTGSLHLVGGVLAVVE